MSQGVGDAPSQITPGLLRFTHFSPYPIAGFNVAFLLLALFCTPWFYWARLGIAFPCCRTSQGGQQVCCPQGEFCDVHGSAQALVPAFLSVSSLQQSPNPPLPLPAWRPQVTPRF